MKEKILVIDDDELLLRSLVKLLEKEGYSLTAVTRGLEGVEKAKESFFDLVILDVRLPDVDGMEVLKKIREFQKDADQSFVVIMTGYASEDVPVKALKLGASDYIMKPFEMKEFLHSVDQNIKLSRSIREKKMYVKKLTEMNQKLETALEEVKRTQQKLLKAEKLATIGKLASGVGHELRNPLASLKNVAFYLKRYTKPDNAQVEEFLDILSKEVDAANKIITDLLDFSRVKKLNKISIPINEIIEEALKSALLDEKIKVIKDISKIGVFVDSDRIKQVFINLFTNAFQAMIDGGTLTITTRESKETGVSKVSGESRESGGKPLTPITPSTPFTPLGFVEVSVSDTGCGMDKETKEQIFEPLFTTKPKGIGLGMAIVHDIIEGHNGKIEVESEKGKGTTFTIKLPAGK